MWIIDLPEIDASGTFSPSVLSAIGSGAIASRHPTNSALIRLGFATEAAATAFATSIGTGADTINDAGSISFIVDHTTFLTSVSQGALVATLSQPYGAGTTYEVVGTPPATLSLSGASVLATSTAPTANTVYPLSVRATSADGKRDVTETFEFAARQAPGATPTPTPTPAPTLGAVTLSGTLNQNVPASGVTLSGLTNGSTVAFSIAGLSVGTSGATRTVLGTPTGSGSLNVTETLAGATNSPLTTNGVGTVVAAPTLGTLTLSGTLTNGTASSGTISGATVGSTIASGVTGLTVNSGARTYAFDGTGSAGSYPSALTETLTGATNSPKVSALSVAMAAVAAPVNTTAPAITGTASVGQVLTVSNGSWTNSPSGYSFQWKSGGVDIIGATSQNYTVLNGDAGNSISCAVTASNSGGNTTAVSSSVTIAAVGSAISSLTIMGATALPDVTTPAAKGNGWVAMATFPDDGVSTFDPKKITLNLKDSTGTGTRTVTGVELLRQQYPNHSTKLNTATSGQRTAYFSLSDDVFATTSVVSATAATGFYGSSASGAILSVANNSTVVYDNAHCFWANIQQERVTGEFPVELFAAHRYGISRVDFYAKDHAGNSTNIVSVSTTSLSSMQTGGQIIEVYKATIPVSGLTSGTGVGQFTQVFAKIYDRLGVLVMDLEANGAVWPTACPQTALRVKLDKANAYMNGVAWIKAGAGTGVIGSSATPFPTMTAATTAMAAYNSANNGHNTAVGTYYLMDDGAGGAVDHGFAAMTAAKGDCWLDIKAAPTNTAVVRVVPASAATIDITPMMRFYVDVAQTVSGYFRANGSPTGCAFAFEGNKLVHIASAGAFPFFIEGDLKYYRNMQVTGVNNVGQSPFIGYAGRHLNAALVLGCTFINTLSSPCNISTAYAFAGNYTEKCNLTEMSAGVANIYDYDGQVIYNNKFMRTINPSVSFGDAWPRANRGVCIMQNIFENIKLNAISFTIGAGGNSQINNLLRAYNTIIGRANNMYEDNANAPGVSKRGVAIHEIITVWAVKTDTFQNTNVADRVPGRVDNWRYRWAVGHRGNIICNNNVAQANMTTVDAINWVGDAWQGKVACTNVAFVNNLGNDGNLADTVGNGDYHLTAGTGGANDAYGMVPSNSGILRYDLDGKKRFTDGRGAAGAFERTDLGLAA